MRSTSQTEGRAKGGTAYLFGSKNGYFLGCFLEPFCLHSLADFRRVWLIFGIYLISIFSIFTGFRKLKWTTHHSKTHHNFIQKSSKIPGDFNAGGTPRLLAVDLGRRLREPAQFKACPGMGS